MRLMRLAVVVPLVLGSFAPLHAQDTTAPTASDSVQLYVATLRILIDSLAPQTSSDRPIWIRLRAFSRDSAPEHPLQPSATQWGEISRAFPTARRAGPPDSLFLCPPGVELRLPGQGCPIRGDGIVTSLRLGRVAGDSVVMVGDVVQSSTSAAGISTWAEVLYLVFERVGRTWRLRAVRGRFIT